MIKRISEVQRKYLLDYVNGMTIESIANKYGKNRSTISRGIHRAIDINCPFGITCQDCVLSECGLSEEAVNYLLERKGKLYLRKRSEMLKVLNMEEFQ